MEPYGKLKSLPDGRKRLKAVLSFEILGGVACSDQRQPCGGSAPESPPETIWRYLWTGQENEVAGLDSHTWPQTHLGIGIDWQMASLYFFGIRRKVVLYFPILVYLANCKTAMWANT